MIRLRIAQHSLMGTESSNPTLSAIESRRAETSQNQSGVRREKPVDSRGFGRSSFAEGTRRRRNCGVDPEPWRAYLCWRVGRFPFANDSPAV